MLWHKTWAESRTRFLVAIAVMALTCVFVVGWQDVDRVLFHRFPQALFTLLAIVLGMGGLLRERDLGTAGFTLALPVSRTRLTLTRAAVAAAEVAALAFVPVLAATLAPLFGPRVHTVVHPLMFATRWLVGVAPLFGLAFFASVLLPGDYTPFVATYTAFFFGTITVQIVRLAKPDTAPDVFTLQEIMGGTRPMTPAILALLGAAAIGLIFAAISWVERQEF